MSKSKLSYNLDKLAALFENGELIAATDPADFVLDVVAEIKQLRARVSELEVREKRWIALFEHTVLVCWEMVEMYGLCGDEATQEILCGDEVTQEIEKIKSMLKKGGL